MSLGVTASGKRKIRSGIEYNKYFPATVGTNPLLSKNADVYQTVDYVSQVVKDTLSHTAKIAPVLKGSTLMETCRKIFNFSYGHIQYKLDKAGEEQLRTPARSWQDRKTGIDCDCFSIFVSSILHNLGIKHAYRICEINGKGYFQHIYIIVPTDQSSDKIIPGKYIVIDPVLDHFNTEAPGITKTHDKMSIPVRVLNGVDTQFLGEIDNQTTLIGVFDAFKRKVKTHVKHAKVHHRSVNGLDGTFQYLGALDYAEKAIDSGSDEDLAKLYSLGLEIEQAENQMSGLSGVEGLGKGAFLKKVAASVKSVKTEVKKASTNASQSKAVSKVKVAAKQAVKAVAKFNPLSTGARAGFLLAMKTNMFGIADQVRFGYFTPAEAQKAGVSESDRLKAKAALDKITKMFVNDLQGEPQNLRSAILSGKQAINGLGVVAAAASTTAAMAFILKAKDFIKGLKIVPFVKQNKDLLKIGKDKAVSLLTKKKPTTVENGALVEKNTTEEIVPPTAPAPSPSPDPNGDYSAPSDYTPAPETVVSDGSSIQVEPEADPGATAPEGKKGMSTGVKLGLVALGILGVREIAKTQVKKRGIGSVSKSTKKKAKTTKSTGKSKSAPKKVTTIIVK